MLAWERERHQRAEDAGSIPRVETKGIRTSPGQIQKHHVAEPHGND